MIRFCLALCIVGLVGPIAGSRPAWAESSLPGARILDVAIADFAYVDTSNEPADQAAVHQERLQALMAGLRRDFAADGQFRLVTVSCGSVPCADSEPAPAFLLRAAKDAGAKILVVGGVHKQSTLAQWLKVQAIDIAGNRIAFGRLFTFRGDSDEAWLRAETFVSREIRTALATR